MNNYKISDEDLVWAINGGYELALRCALERTREFDKESPLLHLLVSYGSIKAVERFLQEEVDVNEKYGDQTALAIAVYRRNAKMVRLLVDNGATFPISNGPRMKCWWQNQLTLLTEETAAIDASSDIIKDLIRAGAEVNKQSGYRGDPPRIIASSTNDTGRTLMDAVEAGDVEAVKRALESGADPNERVHDWSVLETAAMNGKAAICKMLIDAGAKITWDANSEEGSLLSRAVHSGNIELIDLILSLCTPEQFAMSGDLIEPAVQSGNPAAVYRLVAADARFDANHPFFLYSLMINNNLFMIRTLVEFGVDKGILLVEAAEHGAIEIVRWLFDQGVDVHAERGYDGYTALMAAVASSNEKTWPIAEFLLARGVNPNGVNQYGNTALNAVAEEHYANPEALYRAKLLLDAGADPNAGTACVLLSATLARNIEMVRLFLEAGAEVNRIDRYGDSAWNVAKREGVEDIAKLLEERGAAEPPGIEEDLHLSIRWNNMGAALRLIREGADLKKLDSTGLTPLMAAAFFWGNEEIVQALLRQGSDIHARCGSDIGWEEWSALEFAIWTAHPNLVKILLDCGAEAKGTKISAPLVTALPTFDGSERAWEPDKIAKHYEIVELLLKAGADANIPDPTGEGFAPLHRAIYRNALPIVKLLLDYGADIDVPSRSDNAGRETPLCLAVRYGLLDIAEFLISSGANVNATNRIGMTPLIELCRSSEDVDDKAVVHIAQQLVEAGADITAQDEHGGTSLEYARRRSTNALFERLKMLSDGTL